MSALRGATPWPASLDDLAPYFPEGIPLDPYTDAPFRYGRTSRGVRISSAGPDPELWGEGPWDDAELLENGLVLELRD